MAHHFADLSHTVEHGLVTYPGLPPPVIADHLSFDQSHGRYAAGTEFCITRVEMVANTGTYIDTPAHRYRGGWDLDGLPLESVAAVPGVVVEGGDTGAVGTDRFVGVDLPGRAVLVRTGWDRHWATPEYGGSDHPYLDAAAAEALVAGGARVVGIDSVNIDATATGDRPVHSILLAAGIPIVEHLTGLDQLPTVGFEFFAVPVRVRGMGAFPVRAFARWPVPRSGGRSGPVPRSGGRSGPAA